MSLSCRLASWCFSCSCRSSISYVAASRARSAIFSWCVSERRRSVISCDLHMLLDDIIGEVKVVGHVERASLNGILEIFRDAFRGDLRSFCDLELIGVKL